MKRNASFFKILRGNFSKQLRIPPLFVKNFKGIKLGKYILRSPTGEFWHVNVEENEKDLCFGSGWPEFAKYHSLDDGEFLVFKYYGKSMFTVKIFGKTACERNIGPVRMNNDPPTFRRENGNRNQEKVGNQKCKSDIFKADSEKEPISLVQSGCLRCGQKPVIGVDKPTGSALPLKSENSFTLSWKKSYSSAMTIPRQLAKEKGLMTRKMVMLTDPTGRSWPVKLSVESDGRLNLKDGCPIWKENNIKIGDTVTFEITEESAMQFHIFRQKKTVPLKSEDI